MIMEITFQSVVALTVLISALSRVIERSEAAPICYGGASADVKFTQYWIPKEGSKDVDDNGNVISLSGPKTRTIKADDGSVIEKTDTNTYNKCVEEGTCILRNGDVINLGSTATTFQVLDKNKFPYGQGSFSNALVPFVSVAANDLPHGTLLYVSELHNFQLPNGKKHNGCVRVDDQGVSFSCHIDWFVLSYSYEASLNPHLPEKAHAKISNCQVLKYV